MAAAKSETNKFSAAQIERFLAAPGPDGLTVREWLRDALKTLCMETDAFSDWAWDFARPTQKRFPKWITIDPRWPDELAEVDWERLDALLLAAIDRLFGPEKKGKRNRGESLG